MDLSGLKEVVELANLDLTDDEFSSLGGELEKVLAFISKMREADGLLSQTEARTAASQAEPARLRRDELVSGLHPDVLLESAPEREDRFIVIPNVL